MAFKDITKVLYDGTIKLDYKDKAHRYYARERIDFTKDEADPKAWGKLMYPKGTTTLLGDTLEKKGLMHWSKGLALRYLFGFYNFTSDDGKKLQGFSKGVGVLWQDEGRVVEGERSIISMSESDLLEQLVAADTAWQRKQKKGADIGSVVHDAIEHYIKGEDFDIAEAYMWLIKDCEYESEALREKALEDMPLEVEQATQAFLRFQIWWNEVQPTLHSAEEIIYSKKHNVCGTYDADLSIPVEHHPMKEKFGDKKLIRCTTDWKTSNASASKEAAMPEGISYQYFIQDAIYEMIRREMGLEPADDLAVVSARKDGGFTVLYASQFDLTVEDCIAWAEAVILCYKLMDQVKKGLIAHGEESKAAEANEKLALNGEEF